MVRGFLHVVDLKTDVVDATVVGTIGARIGILLRLPVQDGQVNVAIGEMEGTVWTATDLFHVKGLHVKGRGFFWVFGGKGHVSDSRHGCLLRALLVGLGASMTLLQAPWCQMGHPGCRHIYTTSVPERKAKIAAVAQPDPTLACIRQGV